MRLGRAPSGWALSGVGAVWGRALSRAGRRLGPGAVLGRAPSWVGRLDASFTLLIWIRNMGSKMKGGTKVRENRTQNAEADYGNITVRKIGK